MDAKIHAKIAKGLSGCALLQEFGKVKIYMPPQDSADEVPKEVCHNLTGCSSSRQPVSCIPDCPCAPLLDQGHIAVCGKMLQELERRQQQVKALSQECHTSAEGIKQAQKGGRSRGKLVCSAAAIPYLPHTKAETAMLRPRVQSCRCCPAA